MLKLLFSPRERRIRKAARNVVNDWRHGSPTVYEAALLLRRKLANKNNITLTHTEASARMRQLLMKKKML